MTEILNEECKWGKFGLIDMKGCKARTKLLKYIESGGRVKVMIECEIHDVFNNYDGIGQEFVFEVKKVKIR